MEIFILYKFYIFFILKSYFKKNLCPQTRTAEHTCEGPPTACRLVSAQSAWGSADRHWKSNEIPFQDIGSHRPLFSFHNSIYNWGPNFKHLHTDPPGNNEKCLSSFIEISDAVFQYHTKLYVFMYIETDKRLHNFLPDASH